MCGIVAVLLNSNTAVTPSSLLCAALTLQPRGPDGISTCLSDGVALGFVRLAVMDATASSMQPLVRGSMKLIYNGEVYNYKQLCSHDSVSDGAAILCALERVMHKPARARAALSALSGVWAGVAVDFSMQRATVFRDPLGVRPLFEGRLADGSIGFASEAKALVALGCDGIRPYRPNTVRVYDKIDGFWTLVNETGSHTDLFYDLPPPPPSASKWGVVRSALRVATALRAAVRERIHCDRPMGCFVSGGLDSTVTAYLCCSLRAAAGLPPPSLFTVAFEGGGSSDLPYARRVAAALGLPLTEVELTVADAVEAVPNVITCTETHCVTTVRASTPQWLLCKAIAATCDVKVIMSGEGADELGGGYMYFHGAPSHEDADQETVYRLKNLFMYDNLRVDRTTAAHGLEVRVPFLSKRVVRAYRASVPLHRRCVADGVEKRALRAAASLLLPPTLLDCVWRKKEALSDGVSHAWVDALREKFGVNRENGAYKRIVEERVGVRAENLVPCCWMPRWSGAADPSARFL